MTERKVDPIAILFITLTDKLFKERSASPQLDLTNGGELNDAELALIEMDVIPDPDESSNLPPLSHGIVRFMSK
jgi:hypothetical protein